MNILPFKLFIKIRHKTKRQHILIINNSFSEKDVNNKEGDIFYRQI